MSAAHSRGWDDDTTEAAAPLLCGYHAQVTERLSDYHSAQIGRQCPDCVAAQPVS